MTSLTLLLDNSACRFYTILIPNASKTSIYQTRNGPENYICRHKEFLPKHKRPFINDKCKHEMLEVYKLVALWCVEGVTGQLADFIIS